MKKIRLKDILSLIMTKLKSEHIKQTHYDTLK